MKVSKIQISTRDAWLAFFKFLAMGLVVFLAQLIMSSWPDSEDTAFPLVAYAWGFGWCCCRVYDLLKKLIDSYGAL